MLVMLVVGLVVGCWAAGGVLGRADALVHVQLAATWQERREIAGMWQEYVKW